MGAVQLSEDILTIAIIIAVATIIVNIILFIAIVCTANNTEKAYKELKETNKRLEKINKNLLDTNMILIKKFSQGNNYSNNDNNNNSQ
jgi:uncharacterized protein YoxC